MSRGCLAGVLLALGLEAYHVLIGSNFHAVLPGRVYRSAQLSGPELEAAVHRQGIRTVVNLRGCCAPFPWYLDECRATQHSAIAQEDICLSASRLPSLPELRRLVEVLDRSAYPLLIHCRRGADRTGLVSTIVLLLHSDASLATARRQLGLRYGHLALGRSAHLDRFLDSYAAWLRQEGQIHSSTRFRSWLRHTCCPGGYGARVEPLAFPEAVRCGQPSALRVRARNTGTAAWHLRPGNNAGIHAGFRLYDPTGQPVVSRRAGLFEATVAPGQSIDLTLALPSLPTPGRYRLWVDMVDEQQCWFYQLGSEPLEQELEVRDEDPAAAGERHPADLAGLAH